MGAQRSDSGKRGGGGAITVSHHDITTAIFVVTPDVREVMLRCHHDVMHT